jgi:hypothetical protein
MFDFYSSLLQVKQNRGRFMQVQPQSNKTSKEIWNFNLSILNQTHASIVTIVIDRSQKAGTILKIDQLVSWGQKLKTNP